MAEEKRPLFMPPPNENDLAPNPKGLPHCLHNIRSVIDQVHVPEGPFDPNGGWEHSYRIVLAQHGVPPRTWRGGTLKVTRRASADGLVELYIAQSAATQWSEGANNTTARIVCAEDKLATPRKWELRSVQLGADRKPVNYTEIGIKGSARDLRGKVGKQFSSNWTLLDAVQRMPFGGEPLAFDLLEDLDKPKRGHRLYYSGPVQVDIGGRSVQLEGFAHIGEGILPHTYWVDGNHRLLMVIGGLVNYLYDPTATLMEEQP